MLLAKNEGKVEKMKATNRGPSKNLLDFFSTQKQRWGSGKLVERHVPRHALVREGSDSLSLSVSKEGPV